MEIEASGYGPLRPISDASIISLAISANEGQCTIMLGFGSRILLRNYAHAICVVVSNDCTVDMRYYDLKRESATIVPFPIAYRRSDISDAAATINALKSLDAAVWWQHRARLLADALRAVGMDEAIVSRQVAAFQRAVFEEPARINAFEK